MRFSEFNSLHQVFKVMGLRTVPYQDENGRPRTKYLRVLWAKQGDKNSESLWESVGYETYDGKGYRFMTPAEGFTFDDLTLAPNTAFLFLEKDNRGAVGGEVELVVDATLIDAVFSLHREKDPKFVYTDAFSAITELYIKTDREPVFRPVPGSETDGSTVLLANPAGDEILFRFVGDVVYNGTRYLLYDIVNEEWRKAISFPEDRLFVFHRGSDPEEGLFLVVDPELSDKVHEAFHGSGTAGSDK